MVQKYKRNLHPGGQVAARICILAYAREQRLKDSRGSRDWGRKGTKAGDEAGCGDDRLLHHEDPEPPHHAHLRCCDCFSSSPPRRRCDGDGRPEGNGDRL